MNSARAERRNDTDRLIAGCELTPSLLPHSSGLHIRGLLHAPKAAGRVPLSALLSDQVRHFARQCSPNALRPIQSVPPQIVGELGRIRTYSLRNYSALRRLELTREMRRYSGTRPIGEFTIAGLKSVGRLGSAGTRERMHSKPRNSLEIPRVLRCVTHVLWWPFLEHHGRVSVRGSRSILQGFVKVGSKFLSLGTPLTMGASAAAHTESSQLVLEPDAEEALPGLQCFSITLPHRARSSARAQSLRATNPGAAQRWAVRAGGSASAGIFFTRRSRDTSGWAGQAGALVPLHNRPAVLTQRALVQPCRAAASAPPVSLRGPRCRSRPHPKVI